MKPLDSYSDPETWLADFKDQIENMREQGARANEALQHAQGVGTAASGEVTVVVGHQGQVQSLNLTDKALALGPTKLSQAILSAWRKAQNSAIDAARDSVAGLVGEDRAHEFLDQYKLPEDETEGAEAAAQDDEAEGRSNSSWVRKEDDNKRW